MGASLKSEAPATHTLPGLQTDRAASGGWECCATNPEIVFLYPASNYGLVIRITTLSEEDLGNAEANADQAQSSFGGGWERG